MNIEFTKKMKGIAKKTITKIVDFFKDGVIEIHTFGSIARGTNDALSDVDIWLTFEDKDINLILENRMAFYAKFGEIILLNEMQHNFPLNGVQTAIIYKIDDELIRVDWYMCPFSSSRIMPESKVLFESKKVETGDMIYETKRTPKGISDRITFFISMCFIGIKKVVRKDASFVEFLVSEFKKYEKEIPQLSVVSAESSFEMIRQSLSILDGVSDDYQKNAIFEILKFMKKVESMV